LRRLTAGFASALRNVKYHWETIHGNGRDSSSFRLWVDAFCIDQTNIEERTNQVQLMGLVYASAESVFSWLAAEDKDLPLAFYILHFLWPMIEEKGRDALQVVEDLEWLR